jgi:hypothetical protein
VPETTVKKGNDYPVGPVVLGFFIFVVIGSCMPSNRLWIFLPVLLFYVGCMLLLDPHVRALSLYKYHPSVQLLSSMIMTINSSLCICSTCKV